MRTRYLTLSRGFYASDEPLVHFGLGQATRIQRLIIDWPSGISQTLTDLAPDRTYTITEPDESAPEEPSPRQPPLYLKTATPIGGTHLELEFDDYARQPLLPQKHSQLGRGRLGATSTAMVMMIYSSGRAVALRVGYISTSPASSS